MDFPKGFRVSLAALFLLGAGKLTGMAAPPRVVAYVPNWIDLEAFAGTIDYGKVTHLNIAFENPRNAEGDFTFSAKNQALVAKAREHHVPVLISIGGGGIAEDKAMQARYFDLIGDAKRAGFVAKLADYVSEHQFDGVDVDLEGPSINKDYGKFIEELAKVLKPKGKLLTCAVSKGYGGKNVPDSVFGHFDFMNIMAYDATGPWNPKAAGPHASMEFARESVEYWVKRGLPKDKAVLGVPFYGHGFGEAARKGGFSYKAIVAEYPGAENRDEAGKTIWYNGLPTIRAKGRYVIEEGLGGMMIWSLDGDAKEEKSLLGAIDETLKLKGAKGSTP